MDQIVSITSATALGDGRCDQVRSAPTSEADLIGRAKLDATLFAELYRLHYAAIGAYLYRRTGDVHATEDMLGETFLAALRSLRRYRRGQAPFRHWLYRIATNVANKHARRLRARLAELELPQELVDPRSLPPESAPDRELVRALRSLAPAHQAVLALHYVEGLAIDEVAQVLQCRAGTVKSRLFRARDALAARLRG